MKMIYRKDIEHIHKLCIIDKSLEFPEWILCEELLGNLGEIKENEDYYHDGKFIYRYYTNTSWFNISFYLWNLFQKKLYKYDIQDFLTYYMEYKYDMKLYNVYIDMK
jgi:hypothetical protein